MSSASLSMRHGGIYVVFRTCVEVLLLFSVIEDYFRFIGLQSGYSSVEC